MLLHPTLVLFIKNYDKLFRYLLTVAGVTSETVSGTRAPRRRDEAGTGARGFQRRALTLRRFLQNGARRFGETADFARALL